MSAITRGVLVGLLLAGAVAGAAAFPHFLAGPESTQTPSFAVLPGASRPAIVRAAGLPPAHVAVAPPPVVLHRAPVPRPVVPAPAPIVVHHVPKAVHVAPVAKPTAPATPAAPAAPAAPATPAQPAEAAATSTEPVRLIAVATSTPAPTPALGSSGNGPP